MPSTYILSILGLFTALAYYGGRHRAFSLAGTATVSLHSRPNYYGMLAAIWCALPSLIIFCFWLAFEPNIITGLVIDDLPEKIRSLSENRLGLILNDIKNLALGNIVAGEIKPVIKQAAAHYILLQELSRKALSIVVLVMAVFTGILAWSRVRAKLRARNHVELIVKILLIICSTIAIFTTIGIILSVLFESIRFFKIVGFNDFLFGLDWSPQMAIREDQIGSSGAFGAVPIFLGTAMISGIAMLVAVPTGLMSAIYLSEYAGKKFRAVAKPLLEILAGIPTVVYGFFAALVVAPFFRELGANFGLDVSSESALTAGLVMGVMIIPFVSSISDDVIHAVPQSMRDGAYALGATKSETIIKVILPAALPGIVSGVLLAVSRAIGETMIVVMAAGLSANLTANPFQTVTTVTVQIVTLLVGDQEFDSPKTLAAFALGLVLFVVTLCLNIIALHVVRRYREQYE